MTAPRPLTDAELLALAMLVQADVIYVDSYNRNQEHIGGPPQVFDSKAAERLDAELRRRGVIQ